MSTYVLSEHTRTTWRGGHRMPARQAYPRTTQATSLAGRWAAAFLAFVVGATALSAGFLLLTGQGIDLAAVAPALALIALASVAYVLMIAAVVTGMRSR